MACAVTVVTTIAAYYVGEFWKARRKPDQIDPVDDAEPPPDDFGDLMRPVRKAARLLYPKRRQNDHIHDQEDEMVDGRSSISSRPPQRRAAG
jgi:hypothetical protein